MVASILRSSIIMGLVASVLAAPTTPTVKTPHGERPVANVHQVPVGGEVRLVDSEIHLLDAEGNLIHVAQNDNAKIKPTVVDAAAAAFETGWVAYADWTNEGDSPISSFKTHWVVPAAPVSYNEQTVFLFNSIEPASGDAILQPVLQYGPSAAGGGEYWSVASWYLVGSQTYYSTLVKTSVGATLDGLITLTSSSGSKYDYTSTFSNVASTSLKATGSAELVWATETLEIYTVDSAKYLPAGSTVFRDIDLKLSSGTPTVSWETTSDKTNGITTKVTKDGATDAEITIEY